MPIVPVEVNNCVKIVLKFQFIHANKLYYYYVFARFSDSDAGTTFYVELNRQLCMTTVRSKKNNTLLLISLLFFLFSKPFVC